MLDFLLHSPRTYFIGAILLAMPAIADAPMPSQEFWEYMAEYGDDSGEVLDPLEYDQILSMKDGDIPQDKDANALKEKTSNDKPNIRNIDTKLEKKSSLQSSSMGAKGARL